MDMADRSPKTSIDSVNRSYDVGILLGCAVLAMFAMVAFHMAFTGPGSVNADVFVMAAMP